MISYAITITKGIKWYRRLGMQLLLGISVVNASMAYRIATRKDIQTITSCRITKAAWKCNNLCLRWSQHNNVVRKNNSGRSIPEEAKTSNGPNKSTKEFEENVNLLFKLFVGGKKCCILRRIRINRDLVKSAGHAPTNKVSCICDLAIWSAIRGKGSRSATVFLFSSRKSTHNLPEPSFFFTSNIGLANGELLGLMILH